MSARVPKHWRLPRAEFLKLRKHRGLVLTTALLTVGVVGLVFLILGLLHAFNPDHHGPAGGRQNFGDAVDFLSHLGAAVAAVLVGAFAATGDVDARVFRDLVATGRSRTQLYLARIPGGLALLWLMVGVAFALVSVLSLALAGTEVSPSAKLIAESGLWLLLAAAVGFALALGIGSLIGTRAGTIAILLGWILVVEPLLYNVEALGDGGRSWLSLSALQSLSPTDTNSDVQVSMSVAAAVVVLVLWTVLPLAAGLWRTRRRDA